jgi:hypothetical protein
LAEQNTTAAAFAGYLHELRKFPLGEKTEHTDRAPIERLLNAFAAQAEGKPKVQHEPKKAEGKGAPDFKITRSGMILGYVETKAIGENLAKVLKSDQLRRYRGLSSNILLTDYLEWIWIGKDSVKTEALCHETDLENRKFKLRDDRVEAVAGLIEGFFSTPEEGIGRAQQLALALATRSKLLRDYLGEELVRQEREHKEGRLFGLFQIFRDQVFHELKLGEFADAFAQMLAYGLFLARLNAKPNDKITLRNARDYVPGSFRLIRELVDFLGELDKEEYRDVRWVVEEVLSIVNGLDLESIHQDLSFRQRRAISRKVRAADEEEHRLFERDPFIYFYEDYLKAYDPAMRKGRGVYYTPPPVVNFIVRAVDDILKESFGIRDGLADNKRVTVLDFACGTGTFLLEVFQQIFENIGGADSGRADLVVRDHILKNLYGFPRIPFPEHAEDFERLAKLGLELVQAHLLKQYPDAGLAKYRGKGNHEIESVRYSEVEQAVWINKDQYFKPVPQNVWDFHIGGYQVLEKYLKSRKGRTLSLDEIKPRQRRRRYAGFYHRADGEDRPGLRTRVSR